jgi:hypothetical protein
MWVSRKAGRRYREPCCVIIALRPLKQLLGHFCVKEVSMKVNVKDRPPELEGVLKEDMDMKDIQFLGEVLMRQKIMIWKNKWHAFWHNRSWW